jgi:anaerobic ribonucleoside-triphosphate reductase activating protein
MLPESNREVGNMLNIASFSQGTRALGPGNRAVVWVQGCPLNCPGCIAPGWIPFIDARRMPPEQLLEKFDLDSIDGFTFSGGEPMQQAAGLARLIKLARRKKNLSLICFTGYLYERLNENPPNAGVPELLEQIDVLVDGPYVQSKNDSLGLRGSTNQRIIHLTSRLSHHNLENQRRNLEVTVRDGEVAVIGIPTPHFNSALDQIFPGSTGRM